MSERVLCDEQQTYVPTGSCVLFSSIVHFSWQTLMTEQVVHLQVGREQLVSLGQCIGKLTHSGKFRLTIGALDVLGSHAKYKVG